jgi:hypothetical protein
MQPYGDNVAVVSPYKHSNEKWGSVKCGELLDRLNTSWFPKTHSAPKMQFVG